jgi:hypothetical protein
MFLWQVNTEKKHIPREGCGKVFYVTRMRTLGSELWRHWQAAQLSFPRSFIILCASIPNPSVLKFRKLRYGMVLIETPSSRNVMLLSIQYFYIKFGEELNDSLQVKDHKMVTKFSEYKSVRTFMHAS